MRLFEINNIFYNIQNNLIMSSTRFQGAEIPDPKSPTGKGQYHEAPAPIKLGLSQVTIPFNQQDYIQAFVAYCTERLQVSCNPQTGAPGNYIGHSSDPLKRLANLTIATAEYGKLKQCEASGNYSELRNIFGTAQKIRHVKAIVSWIKVFPNMHSDAGSESFTQTQTTGTTSTETQTSTFAKSIGLSGTASYEAITGALSANFSWSYSSSFSISITNSVSDSIKITVPPHTTSQFWQLVCTYIIQEEQNIQLTVGGGYLQTSYTEPQKKPGN